MLHFGLNCQYALPLVLLISILKRGAAEGHTWSSNTITLPSDLFLFKHFTGRLSLCIQTGNNSKPNHNFR